MKMECEPSLGINIDFYYNHNCTYCTVGETAITELSNFIVNAENLCINNAKIETYEYVGVEVHVDSFEFSLVNLSISNPCCAVIYGCGNDVYNKIADIINSGVILRKVCGELQKTEINLITFR